MDKQTHRETDRRTERKTGRQTDGRMNRQSDRYREILKQVNNKEALKCTDVERHKHAKRHMQNHKDIYRDTNSNTKTHK